MCSYFELDSSMWAITFMQSFPWYRPLHPPLYSARHVERRTISFYPTFSFVLSMDSASTTTVLERWKCDDTQQWRAIICPVVRDEREFLRFGTQVQLVLFRMAIGWWLHRYRDIYHRSELNNMIPRAIVCGKCGE